MKLPSALTPWAQQLAIFPVETSLALGPLVQRMALAVGPLSVAAQRRGDQPDGLQGLARRGPYERLLLTELALADEAPDEFIRRAVMGEHLFLDLARVTPTASRTSCALFDTGPNQLGAPRIAHLAALIVLARRADAARAHFVWGLLQDAQTRMCADVSVSSVPRLLNGRGPHEAAAAHLQAWRARLADIPDVSDVWLVGGARLGRLAEAKQFSQLHLSEVFAPDTRQLRLTVSGASGGVREATLELPEPRACTRLLRDPFEEAAAPLVTTDTPPAPAEARLLFAKSGDKLLMRNEKCGVVVYVAPNSPRAAPSKPKSFHTRRWQPVVAAGHLGRSLALFTVENDLLRLEYARPGNFKLPEGFYAGSNQEARYTPPQDVNILLPCFDLPTQNWGHDAVVLDARNTLLHLAAIVEKRVVNEKPVVGVAKIMATDVVAAALAQDRFIYVGREWPGESFHIFSFGETIERREIPYNAAARRAFFGYGPTCRHPHFGLLALEKDERNWAVITRQGESLLLKPPDLPVVGVLEGPSGDPGLLVVGADKRTLHLHGHGWHKLLLHTWQPIQQVTVCPNAPHIAYTLENGEIAVHSLKYNALVCRYLGGAPVTTLNA